MRTALAALLLSVAICITVEAALRQMDSRFEDASRTLGASSWYTFRRVTMPAIRPALIAGAVLSWARALGEFGATITFAGNFPGRTQTMPLVEVARARTRAEALAGLDAWKAKHPEVVPLLHETDVLVDGMRGSSSLWYRIRVNLQHVPADSRPEQAELEVDYDPWAGYRGAQRR